MRMRNKYLMPRRSAHFTTLKTISARVQDVTRRFFSGPTKTQVVPSQNPAPQLHWVSDVLQRSDSSAVTLTSVCQCPSGQDGYNLVFVVDCLTFSQLQSCHVVRWAIQISSRTHSQQKLGVCLCSSQVWILTRVSWKVWLWGLEICILRPFSFSFFFPETCF